MCSEAATRPWDDARIWLVPLVSLIALRSVWNNADFATWAFEVLPGLAGIVILILVYPRFRLATVLYVLVVLHFLVLAIGG